MCFTENQNYDSLNKFMNLQSNTLLNKFVISQTIQLFSFQQKWELPTAEQRLYFDFKDHDFPFQSNIVFLTYSMLNTV